LGCELEPLKNLSPPDFSSCPHTTLLSEGDILFIDPATGSSRGLEFLTSLEYPIFYTIYTTFPVVKERQEFIFLCVFYIFDWFQSRDLYVL